MKPTAKYLGDDHFQDLLSEIECDMPAYEIRAYLLGFIIAIENVPFSFIVDEILLAGTDLEVVFDSDDQAQRFTSQLLALWNQIADDVKKGKVPKLRKLPKNLEDGGLLLMSLVSRMNEIDSFLGALAEGGTHVDNCPDLKATEVLDWLERHSDIYEELLEKIKKKKDTQSDRLKVECVFLEYDDKWPKNFKILERGLRQIRLSKINKPQFKKARIGRNDPCPCGSGKKYKKCCGTIH